MPTPVTHPYRVTYSAQDVNGGDLADILGANIYLRKPGSRHYEKVGFLPFADDDDVYPVEIVQDGAYAIAHTVKTRSRESELSDPSEMIVNIRPPEKPVPGLVFEPGPDPSGGSGIIIEYGVTYPKNDVDGNHLLAIGGVEIEVCYPGNELGSRNNPIEWLPWPYQDAVIRVDADGSFRFRHRVVGACSRSEWSNAVPISVNLLPPAKPPAGSASATCRLAPKNQ